MKIERQILTLQFGEEGIVVHYVEKGDVRVGGAVSMQKMIEVRAGHPDYDEDMDHLHTTAKLLLANVLEDFESSPAYDPLDDVDDDDKGMGER